MRAAAAGAVKRVAVIGAGAMGLGIAQSLKRAGLDVVGYDLSAAAKERLVTGRRRIRGQRRRGGRRRRCAGGHGGQRRTDAIGAARTGRRREGDEARRRRRRFGDDRARRGARAGAGGRGARARLSRRADQRRRSEIRRGRTDRDGFGKPAAFERARPVLEAMAATVYELGAEAGIGSSFKLVNQLLAGVHIAAACEAIALRQAARARFGDRLQGHHVVGRQFLDVREPCARTCSQATIGRSAPSPSSPRISASPATSAAQAISRCRWRRPRCRCS